MRAEFLFVLLWYGYVLLFGWASFPLVFRIFAHFPDRGFSFSKPLGFFMITYLIWLSTSLKITHYQRETLAGIIVLYLLLNLILCVLDFSNIVKHIKSHFSLLFGMEGLFLVIFLACLVVRMYTPDIAGAEKEADFTFLNAIVQSDTFPPKDTWFAGEHLNYYYFGYAIWATLIKASGIVSSIGFNLALATIMGIAAVAAFGVVYHLTRSVPHSLLSSCLLTIFGNLDGLVQIIQRQGTLLPFDWWRSSRVIPDTINEFPYFSFLLGDLHAHFMSIPFLLMFIGILLQVVETACSPISKKYAGMLLLFTALLLGGTAVINTWDYPTSVIITGLCLIIAGLNERWKYTPILKRMVSGGAIFVWLLVVSRFLFLPFYRHFTPQATVRNLRFVAGSQRTGIFYFLVIYGVFIWGLLPALADKFRSIFPSGKHLSRDASFLRGHVIALSLALFYVCATERVFLIASLLSILYGYIMLRSSYQVSFHPVFLFMAFAIIAGCEIVYIKDFYGHPLERQNTIFKFYYQAWILLSIGVPAAIFYSFRRRFQWHRGLTVFWKIVFVFLCGASCLYPVLATFEKTSHFRGERQGGLLYLPTLNGISYIAYQYPFEYEAITWIQKNLDKHTVILEATGNPYSFFGRIATTTGRSTVLGWGNHEALWRDQTWKSITQRTQEIKNIYETADKANIMDILAQYQIEYIYVGILEKQTYQMEGLQAFQGVFPVVYENEVVKIYKVPERD